MCVQDGNYGVVTGWGLTRYLGKSSRFLRKVTLPVVGYRDCSATTDQVRPAAPRADVFLCSGGDVTSLSRR